MPNMLFDRGTKFPYDFILFAYIIYLYRESRWREFPLFYRGTRKHVQLCRY